MSLLRSPHEIVFPLYDKQAEFLDAPEFVKAFSGGQGAGKTRISAYDMLARLLPNRLYTVVAPTYSMLRDATLRTFRQVGRITHQWIEGEAGFSKTEYTARVRTLQGGQAEVLFRSGDDPDRLRGPNLSGLWMDEASLMGEEVYQIGVARLREEGQQGFLTACFTPKGRGHWTFEVFGKDRPGVKLVTAKTSDNPFLDTGFVERVYQEYSGLRREQELGGQFVTVEGAEWPPEYFPPSIWFEDWPEGLVAKVMALDPSKGRSDKPGDYSAFVLLGVDKQGVLWVDADMDQQRTTSQQVDRAIELNDEFQPQAFGIETNQFQELLAIDVNRVSRERGKHLPVYGLKNFTTAKDVRIRSLTPYLACGDMRFRNTKGGKLLVQQLQEFPEAKHDDGPDCTEMCVRLLHWLLKGKVAGSGGPQPVR